MLPERIPPPSPGSPGAEALASRERRSVNDVLCDALETYYARDAHDVLREIGIYAESRNPGYTEDDVPRLIREVREEQTSRQA